MMSEGKLDAVAIFWTYPPPAIKSGPYHDSSGKHIGFDMVFRVGGWTNPFEQNLLKLEDFPANVRETWMKAPASFIGIPLIETCNVILMVEVWNGEASTQANCEQNLALPMMVRVFRYRPPPLTSLPSLETT